MPLGYCTRCDQLKSIIKLGLKLGSREAEWAPVDHRTPTKHELNDNFMHCDGEVALAKDGVYTCSVCGQVPEIRVIPPTHCSGSRKPIR